VEYPDRSKEKSDNIPLAIGVIVITVLALSLGDALIKKSSGSFVIWQIFVVRSLIAVPCLLIFMATMARSSISFPKAMGWTTLRSLLLVVMWISYYLSLPYLPLSVAAAVYYTLPIFITLFSSVIVGDRISSTGWLAIVMGFSGVLLILRPKAGDFSVYALLPLFSAMLYALAMILTRTKCRSEHPLLLSLVLNLSFVVVGGVASVAIATLPDESRQGFLLAHWASMGLSQWYSMGLLAVAILFASIGTAIAYQNGPSSIIGVFDFSYVGFAVLWGIVFFSEVPDAVSLLGIAFIVVAGVISLRR